MTGDEGRTGPYRERLHLPIHWWFFVWSMLGTFWLALAVAVPPVVLWVATGALVAAIVGPLLAWGSAVVAVDAGVLRAGRAHIDVDLLGAVTALDRDATRLQAGQDADPRAHLLLRPYLARAVRVDIKDPQDPTPYWLISSRRPGRLALAITSGRSRS
ncbi:DUF3093 domain-containing protein [Nocardioides sp. IC4_145]|uniref:DUF3093 family protein n=1 Tax=Nocardioides sp. IC4_145 TaxID=2714037 RepID=UPI0014082359|nr:DUF3093 domain-containing protein [Nocardioides sp. IC4_145]